MGKLTRDQRIELYQMYKEGWAIGALSREYGICKENVKYLIRLIDEHGTAVLRDGKCRKYAPALKEQIVKEVLVDGNSITKTALKYGLSSKTALSKWIQNYQANQGVIVEKQRGRKPKDVGGGHEM